MAQPIPLEIPPRNPRAELRSRLEQAPEEHAEAVLAAYEVLEQLHERGVLEIMRGALAASDEILEKVVDNARAPESHSCHQKSPFLASNSRQYRTGMVQGHVSGNSRRHCRGHRGTRETNRVVRIVSKTHKQRQSARTGCRP